MNALTHLELFAGLFSAAGVAALMFNVATGRSPKFLRDEIAQQIEKSITVLDCCNKD
ncbi:hypothetical protein QTH90_00675 [Variovorax sp. J2P1-59]|uniref:hypothetical protein n=1 Tax=Variovorax flavidus TaxID=3053501 RepID=UPI002578A075|nr:hypothetical protein [Variovorax sp. J2P1-59]MDM0072878.1 hypothetical protein [Variovorax sp. J2P1-59]